MNDFLQSARRAVRQAAWDPRRDLEVYSPDQEPPRYGRRTGVVKLKYDAQLRERLTQSLAALGPNSITLDEAFDAVIAARVFLQVGSHKVCPFSSYDYADMLEASSRGLRSVGASEAQVKDFTVPLTSFFIASVIGCIYGIEGPDPASFRCGWMLDQIASYVPQASVMPPYAAVYVNIQLAIWSDDVQLAGAVRATFPSPLETLPFETDRGVAILLDTYDHVGQSSDGLAWQDAPTRELIVDELKFLWRKWPVKCFQFAELLAPYLIGDPQGRLQNPQLHLATPGGTPSEQAAQRWDAQAAAIPFDMRQLVEQDGFALAHLPGTPFDPFADRLEHDRWFRHDLIRYGIGTRKTALGPLLGFDTLDVMYRDRAVNVSLSTEEVTRGGAGLNIAYLSREKFDDAVPTLNSVDFGATQFDAHGQLQLFTRQLPITDSSPAIDEMSGFPDLMFIVDSSGSMQWNPQAGEGAYDSLLRAVYSVFAFLESRRKAPYMRFAAVNFSGATLKTDWHDYSELRTVKKMLLKHQAGGTVLNASVVEALSLARQDSFMCLMISDGQISNVPEVCHTVDRMVAGGNSFVFVQIGALTPLVTQLQAGGHSAHVLARHQDLEGLCLDYSRQTW